MSAEIAPPTMNKKNKPPDITKQKMKCRNLPVADQ